MATVIGLDIGGSKTRGIRWHDGAIAGDCTVGSANVQNVSLFEATGNLAQLFAGLGADGVDEVCAGAGGIDTPEDAAALAELIGHFLPDARVRVVHDTRLLLAAARTETGIAVIAGTGSAAWGLDAAGAQSRAGGWGYLLGDEGSGYWFGREAVRHSLRRANRGLAPDVLTRLLLERCGLREPEELIAHFHAGTTRQYWAALSPLVFDAADAGHGDSLALVEAAGADLAELAAGCAAPLGNPGPVVLGGGLGMNQPRLQDSFTSQLAARGLDDVRILDRDPVFGALELATHRELAPTA
ncbi:N-acetylglucosamine kinase [Pseudarthrobacter sp. P1]|uniref:N-acetylglucosamine kinase n=1 Tax=Pseudarthrobacter sp. P1 TaxID=3418418 RepID=UPI003CF8EFDE